MMLAFFSSSFLKSLHGMFWSFPVCDSGIYGLINVKIVLNKATDPIPV